MTGFDLWNDKPLREMIEDGMIVQLDVDNSVVTSPLEIVGNTEFLGILQKTEAEPLERL